MQEVELSFRCRDQTLAGYVSQNEVTQRQELKRNLMEIRDRSLLDLQRELCEKKRLGLTLVERIPG